MFGLISKIGIQKNGKSNGVPEEKYRIGSSQQNQNKTLSMLAQQKKMRKDLEDLMSLRERSLKNFTHTLGKHIKAINF